MATITEDYVSFEIAKLLKEKGFNESCYTYYDDIDGTINRFDKGYHFNNTSYPWGVPYDVSKAKKYIVAPTQQMAMKWLREEHNIHIELNWDKGNQLYSFQIWKPGKYQPEISSLDLWRIYKNDNYPGEWEYEETAEAAIKYCLKHLI